ncbi:MAG TPA: transposase [Fibrobacteraceae bacterium]|nr:transposase [Fibrobacteraceae bacterium]
MFFHFEGRLKAKQGILEVMERNHYSPELIANLVRQVLQEGQPLTHVAKAQGIHPGVLSKWVKRKRVLSSSTLETGQISPKEELDALRARVHVLEERVETLRSLVEKCFRERYR